MPEEGRKEEKERENQLRIPSSIVHYLPYAGGGGGEREKKTLAAAAAVGVDGGEGDGGGGGSFVISWVLHPCLPISSPLLLLLRLTVENFFTNPILFFFAEKQDFCPPRCSGFN